MTVNGVGGQPPTTYVGNSTGTGPVQSPKGGINFTEIDPFSVQTGYSVEEQMVFDELSGGLPPPGWPPAQSSPEAQKMLEELGAMIQAAGNSPTSREGEISMAQAMRMLKELMLKNRTSELSLRDQQIAQIYDLKLQAIEKDKEAAQAAFVSAVIKGSFEIASGAVNVVGGVRAVRQANADQAILAQSTGTLTQGISSGLSGLGNVAAAFYDNAAAMARAEADTLRALADKLSNQLQQTGERYAIAREVFLDTQQTQKGIDDTNYQTVIKRLSV